MDSLVVHVGRKRRTFVVDCPRGACAAPPGLSGLPKVRDEGVWSSGLPKVCDEGVWTGPQP